jgi:hypothetical protein
MMPRVMVALWPPLGVAVARRVSDLPIVSSGSVEIAYGHVTGVEAMILIPRVAITIERSPMIVIPTRIVVRVLVTRTV